MPQRVLMVEDDTLCARIVSLVLTSAGHRLRIAASIDAAREALAQERFDAVILDINLPDGNGLHLLRDMRCSAGYEPPVIVLSALKQEISRTQGRAAGAWLYLTKPFSPGLLLDQIHSLAR